MALYGALFSIPIFAQLTRRRAVLVEMLGVRDLAPLEACRR